MESPAKRVRSISVGVALLSALSCVSGPPPVLEHWQSLDPGWTLLTPDVRLFGPEERERNQKLADLVQREAVGAVTEAGFSPQIAGPETEPLREALVEQLKNARQGRGARFKPGTELSLAPQAAAVSGAGPAAIWRVTGFIGDPNQLQPLPPDAVLVDVNDRPDYIVPFAGSSLRNGVSLELLLIDVKSGKVVTHRRVMQPRDSLERIELLLPRLIRETLRGLHRTGQPIQ